MTTNVVFFNYWMCSTEEKTLRGQWRSKSTSDWRKYVHPFPTNKFAANAPKGFYTETTEDGKTCSIPLALEKDNFLTATRTKVPCRQLTVAIPLFSIQIESDSPNEDQDEALAFFNEQLTNVE